MADQFIISPNGAELIRRSNGQDLPALRILDGGERTLLRWIRDRLEECQTESEELAKASAEKKPPERD